MTFFKQSVIKLFDEKYNKTKCFWNHRCTQREQMVKVEKIVFKNIIKLDKYIVKHLRPKVVK